MLATYDVDGETEKSNLRNEGVLLAYSWRDSLLWRGSMAAVAWGHIASVARKQTVMNAGIRLSVSSLCGRGLQLMEW